MWLSDSASLLKALGSSPKDTVAKIKGCFSPLLNSLEVFPLELAEQATVP